MRRTCDVIIPTYNSAAVIPQTLAALLAQTCPVGWQVGVILSDDGSTDDTVRLVRDHSRQSSWSLRVSENRHGGVAVARNRAITQSDAAVIFLLGADIVLRPGALMQHLGWHEAHPADTDAALGMVRWDPRLRPTTLMEWMTHGGSQNNYDALLGTTVADPRHFFYGAHLSLKRTLLVTHPFSTNFTQYGWEDLELGRRLAEQSHLRLHVLHDAIGVHHHAYSVRALARRQRFCGAGAVIYQQLYPKETLLPRRDWLHHLRYGAYVYSGLFLISYGLVVMCERYTWSIPALFKRFIAGEFWRGVQEMVKIIPI